MPWVVALALLALAALNYALHRDVLYPGFIQAALWAFTTFLFAASESIFIPVDWPTWFIIIVGAISFSLGSYAATRQHTPYLKRNWIRGDRLPSETMLTACLILAAIGTLGVAYIGTKMALSGPTLNPAVNLRMARNTSGFGIWGYAIPFTNAVALACLLRTFARPRPNSGAWKSVLAVGLGLLLGVLSTGRGSVIFLLCAVTGGALVLRRLTVPRTVAMGIVAAVAIFAGGALLLAKGADSELGWAENASSIWRSFLVYTVGSIPAYGVFLESLPPAELGTNSFRFFTALLSGLGFDLEVVPLVQDFVAVPAPTNVYTMYQQYTRDFWLFGPPVFQFLFGLIHGWIYKHATVQAPRAISIFWFSISLFPLLTQHFVDFYVSGLSTWIQYTFYGTLLLRIVTRPRTTRPTNLSGP